MATKDGVFTVYQRGGYLKNCRFVKKVGDIPKMLTAIRKTAEGDDIPPAVTVKPDGDVEMLSWDPRHHLRRKTAKFPFILHWCNTKTVEGGLAAWPQKGGFDKLDITDQGRCYRIDERNSQTRRYEAIVVTTSNKQYLSSLPNVRVSKGICRIRNSHGKIRTCEFFNTNAEAVIVNYGDSVEMFHMYHSILETFYVERDGKTVGTLADLVRP